jgi:hypothetical protein
MAAPPAGLAARPAAREQPAMAHALGRKRGRHMDDREAAARVARPTSEPRQMPGYSSVPQALGAMLTTNSQFP